MRGRMACINEWLILYSGKKVTWWSGKACSLICNWLVYEGNFLYDKATLSNFEVLVHFVILCFPNTFATHQSIYFSVIGKYSATI